MKEPTTPRRTAPSLRPLSVLSLAALLLAGLPAAGQEAPPGVFGEVIEVRVVNIEVVVTDRDGNRVTGLGPADFKLKVDGKETPIDYFTEIRGGAAIEVAPGAEQPGIPALAPGNPVGTSYLVFVDELFALPRDRDRVLRSLMEDLPRLQPEDRMAIVAYDGRRLEMLTSWSQSTAALERALKRALERPSYGLQRMSERRSADLDRAVVMRGAFIDRRVAAIGGRLDIHERAYAEQLTEQVERSVDAAAATLRGFANPPGRKVMLLLSGGWPLSPTDYVVADLGRPLIEPDLPNGPELFRPLTDTANQLGYTVYSIDLPGVETEAATAAEARGGDSFSRGEVSRLREQEVQDSLRFVSVATGGEALLNDRSRRALEVAAADTRSYYWLGFTPQRRGNDKRWRIDVDVTRPGLRVRSREGFLDSSRSREVSMAVESSLLFGNPPSGRPLAVAVDRSRRSGMGKAQVPLVVTIPLDQVTFVPQDGQYIADLELRVAALDDQGRRSEIPVIPVRLAGRTAPKPGQTARYETAMALRRQPHQLVVSLFDPASGEMLSTTLEVTP